MAKQTTTASDRKPAATSRQPAATASGEGGRRTPNIFQFFQESRAELRKVTWPTREEATKLTTAVIVMTVSISAFLGIVDTVLDYLVKPVLNAK